MTVHAAGLPFTEDYYPTLGGAPYDPADAGGAVGPLRVYSDPDRTVLLQTIPTSTKVSSGQYRFNVSAIATGGTYYYTVVWVATGSGPTVTDSNETTTIVEFGGSTDPAMYSYAAEADLLLGDLEIPATVDKMSYLIRASRDIDVALAALYVTPITTADLEGRTMLRSVAADLGTAYLVMAQAQGGEDNRINAYAGHLYDRAWERLSSYRSGGLLIGGAVPAAPAAVNPSPIAVAHQDTQSLVQAFYNFTGDAPLLPVAPPVVRPYDA